MKIGIFDRVFYLFTEERQKQKLIDFINDYFLSGPALLIIGIVLVIYFLVWVYAIRNRRIRLKKFLNNASYWLCFFLILQLSVLNRKSGTREIRITPEPWFIGSTAFHESNVLLAVIDFCYYVPYGFLTIRIFRGKHMFMKTFGIILMTSLGMEILQYVFAKGVSSSGDVIANTLGGLFGAGVYYLLHRLTDRKKGKGIHDI